MSARAALRRVLANAANAPLAMRTAQRGMAGGVQPPASTLVPRMHFFALCLICVLIINNSPAASPPRPRPRPAESEFLGEADSRERVEIGAGILTLFFGFIFWLPLQGSYG